MSKANSTAGSRFAAPGTSALALKIVKDKLARHACGAALPAETVEGFAGGRGQHQVTAASVGAAFRLKLSSS